MQSGGPWSGAEAPGGLRVSWRPLLASQARLSEVDGYLQNVLSGRLPVNHRIIYQLQDSPDPGADTDPPLTLTLAHRILY